jgi:transposase, IS5 family
MKLIPVAALATVVVDSTVQEKAIAHPNDARLLEVARRKLVHAAKDAGVDLKQSFAKEGKTLRFKAGRYAHARQFKRLRKTVKRQRTIVAGLCREIVRKALAAGQALGERTTEALGKAAQIVAQAARRKNDPDTPKLYARHAP